MKRPAAMLALLVPALAAADDDRGAAKHAELVAAMAKRACVPPIKIVDDGVGNDYAVHLGVTDGAPVVCASRGGGDLSMKGKPFQCWNLDPRTHALTARPPVFLPGHAYGIGSACAEEGFCRPKEKPAASRDVLAVSLDGSKVARVVGQDIQIFDAKSKAFERSFPMLDEQGNGNGLGTHDVLYLGEMLVIVGLAAGPDGSSWLWNARKGTFLGPIGDGTEDGDVNVYGGTYGLVDANHFFVRDAGYREATVDLTTGAIAMRVLPKPAGCSGDGFAAQQVVDIIGDGPSPRAKCTKAIRAAQKRFWKKPPATRGMIFVEGTGYSLVHGTKAELRVLRAGAKKPGSVLLPVCKLS